MIVRLTGTLIEIDEEAAVIEREGVAREVLIPKYAFGELAATRGRDVTLYTLEFYEGNQATGNLVPRIVGFAHVEDRLFFKRFISVKGIGVRKALKALAEPTGRVADWIESGETKALSRLPGIGKRASELIVAELRGKVADLAMLSDGVVDEPEASLTDEQRVALEILVAWGDPRADAERWLARAAQLHSGIQSADEWVRFAYKIKTGVEG